MYVRERFFSLSPPPTPVHICTYVQVCNVADRVHAYTRKHVRAHTHTHTHTPWRINRRWVESSGRGLTTPSWFPTPPLTLPLSLSLVSLSHSLSLVALFLIRSLSLLSPAPHSFLLFFLSLSLSFHRKGSLPTNFPCSKGSQPTNPHPAPLWTLPGRPLCGSSPSGKW